MRFFSNQPLDAVLAAVEAWRSSFDLDRYKNSEGTIIACADTDLAAAFDAFRVAYDNRVADLVVLHKQTEVRPCPDRRP